LFAQGQGRSQEALERAIAAQEKHTKVLMAIDGVEGTAVGLDDNDQVVVKIYTARPGVANIPANLEKVPVQVEVTGQFVARLSTTDRWPRPVPIGISTGHPDITAGTISCRVTDGTDVYALSNNHVYANANDATIGDEVIQPGTYDGGSLSNDFIGVLHDFEPIDFSGGDNTIDAAIAMSTTDLLSAATPGDGYGTPGKAIVSAGLGMLVQKYGRTTGWTHGQISGINVTVNVCYESLGGIFCIKQARFVNQITITPGGFSGGGDSGSLIVTDDNNRNPVGLLFAGSDTMTIANLIGPVLARFGVTVDDSSSQAPVAPVANFQGNPTSGNAPLTVNFTDLSTGNPTSWSWNFGDGVGTSSAQNPTYEYASAGTYTVTLTVTNDEGSDAETKTDYITVTEQAPVADFSASPTSGDAPLTVNFTDLSTGEPISWLWDFGDGTGTSTAQNPFYTYSTSGAYTVTLTATNAYGDDDERKVDYINVTASNPLVADFEGSPTSGDAPLTVHFTDLSSGNPGEYDVMLIVMNLDLEMDIVTKYNYITVTGPTVNTPPTVAITAPANGATFTEGDPITFTGTASDTEDGDISASISWTSDLDGSIGTGTSVSRSDLSVGTHTITASVIDSGGLSASDTVTVNVESAPANTPPTVAITAPTDGASFTEGDLITFTGTASDTKDGDISASISWTSDLDGSIGTGASVSRSDLSVGTHTITASVTDSGGDTATASLSITVTEPSAGVTVVGIDPDTASNGSGSFDATITGSGFAVGASVTFENGSGPAPKASNIIVTENGTIITVTIKLKSGGPPRNRQWDVRVTNPDSSTGVLVGGFTVTVIP
jgi:PKD repeat protein